MQAAVTARIGHRRRQVAAAVAAPLHQGQGLRGAPPPLRAPDAFDRFGPSEPDHSRYVATDMNRLLKFLDGGLNRIGNNVATLTNRAQQPGENLLTATIDAVDILTKAAHFKQAIEEGWIEGPRIVPSAHALGATGGHCDETYLPPSFDRKSPAMGDSPEELRKRSLAALRSTGSATC